MADAVLEGKAGGAVASEKDEFVEVTEAQAEAVVGEAEEAAVPAPEEAAAPAVAEEPAPTTEA